MENQHSNIRTFLCRSKQNRKQQKYLYISRKKAIIYLSLFICGGAGKKEERRGELEEVGWGGEIHVYTVIGVNPSAYTCIRY